MPSIGKLQNTKGGADILYCLKHKEFIKDNHECESKYIIEATENMSCLADKIYDLGFRLAGAGCEVSERLGYTGQVIRMYIEFKIKYDKCLLPTLPDGWVWFDFLEPVRTIDRWGHYHTENGEAKSALTYTKIMNYKDIQKAEKKAKRIIEEMLNCLNTYDRGGLMVLMTFLDS